VSDVEEWARIICLLANNKAADRNGTVSEMLRLLGKGSLFQLAAVMSEMWLYEVRPGAWSTIDIVPIYKGKGDKSVCDNYRPISIIDIYSKAFGTLLKRRVDKIIDGRLLEAQAGFRRGRSCQDMTFVMRMLRGYSKEMKRKLYSCFIDLRKAYDSVDRDALWMVLKWYGVDGHLLKMIQLLYGDLMATVRVGDERSDKIDLKSGVKQGCVLSPILFNIYLDYVMRQAMSKMKEKGVKIMMGEENDWDDPVKKGNRRQDRDEMDISALLYADDTSLVATSYDDLCDMIKVLDDTMCEWGLTISIIKTKIVVFGDDETDTRDPMMLRGEEVNVVNEFKYLGSVFTSDGSDVSDVKARIAKAWASFHGLKRSVWRQRGFSLDTKIRVYKTFVLPIFLYGCESWVLTDTEEEMLEVAQRRMLRSIMRIRLIDHVTNDEIMARADAVTMRDHLRRSRLRWFGKVMQMNEDRWPKIVLCGCLADCMKRPQGRPATRWTDKMQNDIKALGLHVWSCLPVVKNISKWTDLYRSVGNIKDNANPGRRSSRR
jgi:hypothetical protein